MIIGVTTGGQLFVSDAQYANAYWMEWSDDCTPEDIDAEGGKYWNGWVEDFLTVHGDWLTKSADPRTILAWAEWPTVPTLPEGITVPNAKCAGTDASEKTL